MATISSVHTPALNSDILLSIFMINADIFSDRQAIHTTRISSQVCRHWRDLMLSTSTIWARLLDMEALHYLSSPKWWNELIKRSGDALLWIRIYSALFRRPLERSNNLKQFFLSVIHGNWHRIQRLFIDDNYSTFGLSLTILRFPAPQLEEFNASLPQKTAQTGSLNEDAAMIPIFTGHAPLLRKFCFKGHILDPKAPWLRQLHFIELDPTYDVRDALAVLLATQNLQGLTIYNIVNGDTYTTLPVVSLPHLKSLHCVGFPQPCATLLDHIIIPLGCSLTLQISGYKKHELAQETKRHLLSIFNIFAHYVEHYLQSNLFNAIHLYYWVDRSISLECRTMYQGQCLINISQSLYHAPFSMTPGETFFNELASLDLTNITYLELMSDGSRWDPPVRSFLGNLRCLDTIHIDSNTLRSLMRLENPSRDRKNSTMFFPFLRVIVGSIRGSSCISDQLEVFARFILSRVRTGRVITTLDMTKTTPFKAAPSLAALAGVKGLRVLYKRSRMKGIFEYRCGSNSREKHVVMI